MYQIYLFSDCGSSGFFELIVGKWYEESHTFGPIKYRLIYQAIDELNDITIGVLEAGNVSIQLLSGIILHKVWQECFGGTFAMADFQSLEITAMINNLDLLYFFASAAQLDYLLFFCHKQGLGPKYNR